MAGVVKAMESAMKSMNLEKVSSLHLRYGMNWFQTASPMLLPFAKWPWSLFTLH